MEDKKMKKVRVKRIKDESLEEHKKLQELDTKLKKVRVKRIKNEVETLEKIRKIRIINFKKEYEDFIKLGASPDEYIENLVNKIALLYFYAKNVDMDSGILKIKLKEIDYKKFMKLYYNISIGKMKSMGIYRKMQNGAILLLNLLTMLKIDMDEKIKLPMNLVDFRYKIENNRICNLGKNDYKLLSLKRMFVIKDNQIIESSNVIKLDDKFKGSNIMVECQKGQFISIPYRYYEKLFDIKELDLTYYIVSYPENEAMAKGSLDEYYDLDMDEIVDKLDNDIVYYKAGFTAVTVSIIISSILYYETLWQSIDEFNSITYSGDFCAKETVTLTFTNDKVKVYRDYDKFIKEYFPFLRL